MSILIFFIILSVLVIVHELGHFLTARGSGVAVEEFGLGYPPRAKKLFTWKGTLFTLNLIPFGGFVKIEGENSTFREKNRGIQALILAAGSLFNLIFAWIVISISLMIGLAAPEGGELPVINPLTTITQVIPHSPAEEAGLKVGDVIYAVNGKHFDPAGVSYLISQSVSALDFKILRGEELFTKTIRAREGVVEGQQGIGVAMELIGTAKLSVPQALWHGGKITIEFVKGTFFGLISFIGSAFKGSADLTQVTGPVGLVGIVGEAATLGLSYLLSFTALISINLAIINLLPFPALDGGRIFFVLIESITRKRVPEKVFNIVNNVGFMLLILLMIFVTFHDVKGLF